MASHRPSLRPLGDTLPGVKGILCTSRVPFDALFSYFYHNMTYKKLSAFCRFWTIKEKNGHSQVPIGWQVPCPARVFTSLRSHCAATSLHPFLSALTSQENAQLATWVSTQVSGKAKLNGATQEKGNPHLTHVLGFRGKSISTCKREGPRDSQQKESTS